MKKQVYQDQVRVPEYFWYDPERGELAGFTLCDGVYQPIPPDEAGLLWSGRLGLNLTRWTGSFDGYEAEWVRWATPSGVLLPTRSEALDDERQRAHRLAERLRALGVDPEEQL